MKKLALLAAARPGYKLKIETLIDKCSFCWSGWSYKINEYMLNILENQYELDGYFNIYWHEIKTPTDIRFGQGTGFVDFKLQVNKNDNNFLYDLNWMDAPNPECTPITDKLKPHRLYVRISEKKQIQKCIRKKWNEFGDFDRRFPLPEYFPFNLRDADFGYVIDPEQ